MKSFLVFLAGLLALIYLLNPGLGVFELLPDNIPFVGNVDEATATVILLAAMRYFGIEMPDLFKKRVKKEGEA